MERWCFVLSWIVGHIIFGEIKFKDWSKTPPSTVDEEEEKVGIHIR